MYVERLVKFLLWQRGGWKVYVGGPTSIGEHIRKTYAPGWRAQVRLSLHGRASLRAHFHGRPLRRRRGAAGAREPASRWAVTWTAAASASTWARRTARSRAVVDGQAIFSEEVVWEPRKHTDPEYHYREIMAALKTAAAKMPRVDAIGGSSAGIYINNRPMVASLFRGIPQEQFGEIKNLFLRIRDEMGVPLEVINDGDVTALAGAMSLEDNGVLGIALGSSEAAGYVDVRTATSRAG